jgi:hypothetical protein
MTIVLAALAALALLTSSPSAPSKTVGIMITATPGQGPVVDDAVLPIGL